MESKLVSDCVPPLPLYMHSYQYPQGKDKVSAAYFMLAVLLNLIFFIIAIVSIIVSTLSFSVTTIAIVVAISIFLCVCLGLPCLWCICSESYVCRKLD